MKNKELENELLKVIASSFPNTKSDVRYIFDKLGSFDETIEVLRLSNSFCIDIDLAIMGIKRTRLPRVISKVPKSERHNESRVGKSGKGWPYVGSGLG